MIRARCTSWKTLLLCITLVWTGPVQAESFTGGTNNNPFANSNSGAAQTAPTNPALNAGGFFSNPNQITDSTASNAQNGRAVKAGDAGSKGNSGAGAAAAAGAALSAAAMQQLAMQNYPEAAQLLGMAGMEFAQAGSSGSSSAQNYAQQGMLTAQELIGAAQSQGGYNPAAVAKQILTPDAVKALQSQGIDPNAFANQLASGNIQSGTDALAALGQDPSAFSADQLAAMNTPDPSLLGENLGNQTTALLALDDQASTNPGAGDPSGATGSGGGGGMMGSLPMGQNSSGQSVSTTMSGPNGATVGARAPGAVRTANLTSARGIASVEPVTGSIDDQILSMLSGASPAVDGKQFTRAQLMHYGVAKPLHGQTIFHVANRNYRGFSKWRAGL